MTKGKSGSLLLHLALTMLCVMLFLPALQPLCGQHVGNANGEIRAKNEYVLTKPRPHATFDYSSMFGGESYEYITDVVCDSYGNVYVTGYTLSTDFPVDGYVNESLRGGYDCFVMKFNPEGNVLLYSAIIGGSGHDEAYSIAVDLEGNVYVVGETSSYDFPVTDPYDDTYNGGYDGFFFILNPEGDSILYSTYIGGSNWDLADSVYVESPGSVFIAGFTESYEFPVTSGALDESYNAAGDGFFLKLNTENNTLVFSSFFGGFEHDCLDSIVLDSAGDIYIVGDTKSNDFPTTPGAFDETYNGGYRDCFVSKINANGDSLIYSTYYGGSSRDYVSSVLVDTDGNVVLVGSTYSADFPCLSAYDDSHNGEYDCYVLKLNEDGNGLVFSSFLGGSDYDHANDAELGPEDSVIITGETDSDDFPTTSGAIDVTDYRDAFALKLSDSGTELSYSTHIGGSGRDCARALSLSSNGHAIIAGYTYSSDFPVTDGYIGSYQGEGSDCFLLSIPDLTDSDGDMLTDNEEAAIGTDMNDSDTDGDSFSDYWEYHNGFDPNDATVPFSEYVTYHGSTIQLIVLIAIIGNVIVFRHHIGRTVRKIWPGKHETLLYQCPSCRTRFLAPRYGRGSRKRECPECGVKATKDDLVE